MKTVNDVAQNRRKWRLRVTHVVVLAAIIGISLGVDLNGNVWGVGPAASLILTVSLFVPGVVIAVALALREHGIWRVIAFGSLALYTVFLLPLLVA